MRRALAFALVLGFAAVASGEEFSGNCTSVHDGDTARVTKADGAVVNVRFVYCDAPEIDQPGGIESRDFVRSLILAKPVTVTTFGTDDYGRVLGEIKVGGVSVNKKVIEEGHGWWFYHYHHDDDHAELGDLEVQARLAQKGLFAAEAPIYPRAWRRGARLDGSGGSDDAGDSDGSAGGGAAGAAASVLILALLPNPAGDDADNETVILANSTDVDVSIDSWRLEDDDSGVFTLSGVIPAGGSRTIRLNAGLQLGNSGDSVRLRDGDGTLLQTVSYGSAPNGRFVLAN